MISWLFSISVPPAVVPTDSLYPVAPFTVPQEMVGVTETPVAAAAGAVTTGHDGVALAVRPTRVTMDLLPY